MEVISEAQLKGFSKYKYSSVDNSPLSNWVMHPFWNFVTAKFIPLWVAPNVLTFAGFLCLVTNYFITFYLDPHFRDAYSTVHLISSSTWFLCGFLHFMSHTLDGCDGKQARRTNNSGPLGELMDHGLDSMAAWLQTISACTCVGVFAYPWVFFTIASGIMLSFFLTHWEKYNTGLLFLPWTYDASQILVSSVYILAGLFGTEVFLTPFFSFEWIHPQLANIRVLDIFIVGSYISMFSQPIISLYNIVTAKQRLYSLLDGLAPLIPITVTFLCFSFWLYVSPTIMETDARLFLTALGLAFSNLTCQLIVAQMSGVKFKSHNHILLPLPIILTLIYHFQVADSLLLYFYVAYATILHVWYGVTLVNTLCHHLNIYCFYINPVKKTK